MRSGSSRSNCSACEGFVSSQLTAAEFDKKSPDLSDDWQNPGLCIIVSVSSNAQVDFFVRGVLAVSCHQAEEWVFGSQRYDIGGKDGRGSCRTHDVIGNVV